MTLELIVILYAVGLALVVTELFVPGVIVGVIGGICLAASVVGTFMLYGPLAGAAHFAVTVVLVAATVWFGLRRLQHRSEGTVEEGYTAAESGLDALIGKTGRAMTPLRPAGIVELDGNRVDVVTGGELLDRGTVVKVVKVEGNRVVVRETVGGAPTER